MVFNIRFLGSRTGHRMNASTSRVRSRRSRRPGVEALEGRALLAYFQMLPGAIMNAQDNLGDQTQSASLSNLSFFTYDSQSTQAGLSSEINSDNEASEVLIKNNGNPLSDYCNQVFTFVIFMGAEYSDIFGPAYPASGSAGLQDAVAQILPEGSEKIGDPVSVDVTLAYTQTASLNGSTNYSAGVNGTGGSASWSGDTLTVVPGQPLPTYEETKTLSTTIGQTLTINLSDAFQTSGSVNPGQAGGFGGGSIGNEVSLNIDVTQTPVIAANSLSWDTTQDGVDYGYTISNANLPQQTTAALYWAPTATFDPTQDTVIPGSVFTTATAAQTDPYTGHIDAASIGTPPPGAKDLLFVVDPNNLLGTFSDSSSVRSIPIQGIELVTLDKTPSPSSSPGINFSYMIPGGLSEGATIEFYWASGDSLDDKIGTDPAYTYDVDTSALETPGSHGPIFIPRSEFSDVPYETTYLVATVESEGQSSTLGVQLFQDITLDTVSTIIPPPTPPTPPKTPAGKLTAGQKAKLAAAEKQYASTLKKYEASAAAYSVLAQGLVDYLNSEEAFETYQINYPERQAAFIGQVAWETAHLTTLTQDAAFGTVGTSTGIGRGYLQITGPPNYGAAAAFLHQSLSKTLKSLATDPQTAARVSAWYWSGGTGVSPVNPYADVWNITAVSQLVNAGSVNPVIKKGPNKGKPVQTNGLAERLAYSQAALQAINEAFETD